MAASEATRSGACHWDEFPLSLAQQGLWVLEQFAPQSAVYNVASALRIRGSLRVEHLQEALEAVCARHESLRTTFADRDGSLVQRIHREPNFSFETVLFDDASEVEKEVRVLAAARQEARRPFDLQEGPLLRARVYPLGEESHLLLFVVHHIVSDATSLQNLTLEVTALYEAALFGHAPVLPELPIQFADYAAWQRERLAGDRLDRLENFWRQQHEHRSPFLELPTDRQRPPVISFEGGQVSRFLAADVAARLGAFARSAGATRFVVYLSTFAALIAHLTGSDDPVIATPIAERNRKELQPLIGYLVNTLPLRLDLSGHPSLVELTPRVRSTVAAALDHGDLPLDSILRACGVRRHPDRAALSQVGFAVHEQWVDRIECADLEIEIAEIELGIAKTELIATVRERRAGTEITLEFNSGLYDEGTAVRLLDEYATLLERVSRSPGVPITELAQPVAPATGGRHALTRNQQLLWQAQQLHAGTPVLNEIELFELRGPMNTKRFCEAVNLILAEADALGVVVDDSAGEVVLRELNSPPTISFVDLSLEDSPEDVAEQWIQDCASGEVDLSARLYETGLLRLSADHHLWYVNHHQLAFDGWSIALLFSEVGRRYSDADASPQVLAADRLEFGRYIEQQQRASGSARSKRASDYWEKKLSGERDPVPFAPLAGVGPTTRSTRVSQSLGTELSSRLHELSVSDAFFSVTPALSQLNLLLALCFAHLHLLGAGNRLSIGTPTLNRPARFRRTIGSFSHAVVVHAEIDPSETFASLVRKVSIDSLESLQYQHFPPRNPEGRRAFDIFLNNQIAAVESFGELEISGRWLSTGHSLVPLGLAVHDLGGTGDLKLEVDFGNQFFDEPGRDRWLRGFRKLMEAVLADPHQSLADINLVTAEEHDRLLTAFNRPVSEERLGTVLEGLRTWALEKPHAIALEEAETSIDYAALEEKTSRVAAALRQRGAGPDSLVAVALGRGAAHAVAMLALWKCGAAFLPVRASDPPGRLRRALEGADLRLGITDEGRTRNLVPAVDCIHWLVLEELCEADASLERAAPEDAQLAYAIFTSGSTGAPKGVLLEHGGVLNHLWAKVQDLDLRASDCVFQSASTTFDISIWQFLAPILIGARVRVASDAAMSDPRQFEAELFDARGTVAEVVPSFLTAWIEHREAEGGGRALPDLRWLLVTGEAFPAQLAKRAQGSFPGLRLLNAYGPTECSDDITHFEVPAGLRDGAAAVVPIGSPIRDLRAYVLDDKDRQVPIGVAGFLCASGRGIGRGYLNEPDATAVAFLDDPFLRGQRMYRTGDLARFREDGALEFLGRRDHQVKIRGQRIELAEVEAAIRRWDEVRDVCAGVHRSADERARLVAWVVWRGADPGARVASARLREELPPAMVPAFWQALTELPLSVNGKIDRDALPAPADDSRTSREPIAPRTRLEAELVSVWARVLGVRDPCVTKDFFDLGGDSLSAIRVVSVLRANGHDLSPVDLLHHPSVAALAGFIASEAQRTAPVHAEEISAELRAAIREQGAARGHRATPNQVEIYDHTQRDSAVWITRTLVKHPDRFAEEAIERALRLVTKRHASLRSGFAATPEGDLLQFEWASTPPAWARLDASGECKEAIEKRIAGLLDTPEPPFDLARPPLWRVLAIDAGEGGTYLWIRSHHLIHDGWSASLLIRDLDRALSDPAREPSASPAFETYARYIASSDREAAEAFYREELAGLEFGAAGFRRAQSSSRRLRIARTLGPDQRADLESFARIRKLSLAAILQAAWAATVAEDVGCADIVLGTVVTGRTCPVPGIAEIVGPVANIVPLRARVGVSATTTDLAAQLQRTLRLCERHGPVSSACLSDWGLVEPDAWPFSCVYNHLVGLLGSQPNEGWSVVAGDGTIPFSLAIEVTGGSDLVLSANADAGLQRAGVLERRLDRWRDSLALIASGSDGPLAQFP